MRRRTGAICVGTFPGNRIYSHDVVTVTYLRWSRHNLLSDELKAACFSFSRIVRRYLLKIHHKESYKNPFSHAVPLRELIRILHLDVPRDMTPSARSTWTQFASLGKYLYYAFGWRLSARSTWTKIKCEIHQNSSLSNQRKLWTSSLPFRIGGTSACANFYAGCGRLFVMW